VACSDEIKQIIKEEEKQFQNSPSRKRKQEEHHEPVEIL
jgi:hypothetical protein